MKSATKIIRIAAIALASALSGVISCSSSSSSSLMAIHISTSPPTRRTPGTISRKAMIMVNTIRIKIAIPPPIMIARCR